MGAPLSSRTQGLHPVVHHRVLDGFGLQGGRVWVGLNAWGRPMAARLVRFLLAHRSRPVPEDELFAAKAARR